MTLIFITVNHEKKPQCVDQHFTGLPEENEGDEESRATGLAVSVWHVTDFMFVLSFGWCFLFVDRNRFPPHDLNVQSLVISE